MKELHKKVFIGIILFWVLLLGGFFGIKEWTLRTGTEVLLAVRPVDPRDLFRGDYVILSYEISRVDAPPSPRTEGEQSLRPIYVQLSVDDEGIAHATDVTFTPPTKGLFIAGKIIRSRQEEVDVEYGIESYFVPEGRGGEIERNLRQMHAKVAVDSSGNAVLKGLVFQGEDVRF